MLFNKWKKHFEWEINQDADNGNYYAEPPDLTTAEKEKLQPMLDGRNRAFTQKFFGKKLNSEDLLKRIKENSFYPDGRNHYGNVLEVIRGKIKKLNSNTKDRKSESHWILTKGVDLVILSSNIWETKEADYVSLNFEMDKNETNFDHIYLKTIDCCYEICSKDKAKLLYKFSYDELALLKKIVDAYPNRLEKDDLYKICLKYGIIQDNKF